MNPYYYLFYKLNKFLNKKGDNEWGPIGALTLFTGWYVSLIYVKILPVTKENFISTYKVGVIFLAILIFIINSILFLSKDRVNKIINRFDGESDISRKIGNFLTILYVALSFGLIFFI